VKGTGEWSCIVKGVPSDAVDYTVLILGPHEGKEVVYTIHPGKPTPDQPLTVLPPEIAARAVDKVISLTIGEARALGVCFAKVE
jgi:hypothetical protein